MKIVVRYTSERINYLSYLKKYLPDTTIYLADINNNAMTTFLNALAIADSEACLHLEEDIWLTENFIEKVTKVISSHEDEVIQFFSMRKADEIVGSRYETGSKFSMNQCFYLPQSYSKAILEYYPKWDKKIEHPTGYDILMADYFKIHKIKYFIQVPSLVDHRVGVSLINSKRSRNRVAKVFKDGVYV